MTKPMWPTNTMWAEGQRNMNSTFCKMYKRHFNPLPQFSRLGLYSALALIQYRQRRKWQLQSQSGCLVSYLFLYKCFVTAPVLKAGHLVSYLFCTSVLFVSCMYLDGGMGGGGWLLTSLFLFYYLYSWASML